MVDIQDLSRFDDNKSTFYRAVIEDNNDPQKLGRVRVRIMGVHPDDKVKVPPDTLPWAEVMVSNIFGLNTGIGISAVPLNGTWCWVFLESGDYNKPVVVGLSVGTAVDVSGQDTFKDPDGVFPMKDRLDESDINRLSRVEKLSETIKQKIEDKQDKEGEFTAGETIEPLPKDGDGAYPDITTVETKSGHVITVDDTPGNERIRLYHKSGSYMELRPDGTMVTKTVKNKHATTTENVYEHIIKSMELIIDESRYTHIKRDNKYLIDKNEDTEIGGKRTEYVKGTQTETVDGAVSEKFNAGQTTNGGPKIDLDAGIITLN